MSQFELETIEDWGAVFSKTPFSNYVNKLDNLKDAFVLGDRSVRCIDEGCPGGVRLAGSGILYQDDAEAALAGKVDGIYSHAECGAAALYAKQNGLDTDNSDHYGIEWAKGLAERLGVPYKGHIGIDGMVRPSGQHIAWVTYYDGSGRFDPSRVEKLPPGFVISRNLLDSEYAKQELEVSINIALGDHGLGERVTPETPFIVAPIGNPHDNTLGLEILTEEAKSVAQKFEGRVIVSSFIAPLG